MPGAADAQNNVGVTCDLSSSRADVIVCAMDTVTVYVPITAGGVDPARCY